MRVVTDLTGQLDLTRVVTYDKTAIMAMHKMTNIGNGPVSYGHASELEKVLDVLDLRQS